MFWIFFFGSLAWLILELRMVRKNERAPLAVPLLAMCISAIFLMETPPQDTAQASTSESVSDILADGQAALGSPTPTTSPTEKPKPIATPKPPTQWDRRQAIQSYWTPLMEKLGCGSFFLNMGAAAIAEGNYQVALSGLDMASSCVNNVLMHGADRLPPGFDNISDNLELAASDLLHSYDKMRPILESGGNEGLDGVGEMKADAYKAGVLIEQATAEARERYVELGGNENDLTDVAAQEHKYQQSFSGI